MNPDSENLDVIALERVERDAWLDLYAWVPALGSKTLGISAKILGTCGLLASKGLPILEFNRAGGLTADEPRQKLSMNGQARIQLHHPATVGQSFIAPPLPRSYIRRR